MKRIGSVFHTKMATQMTHEDAVKSQVVERYLLEELAPEEREQFEEHYFDCPECAAEVRAGAIFACNARAVFAAQTGTAAASRPAAPARVRGWLGWRRPVFAFAFSLLLVVNIALVLRVTTQKEAPQPYPAFFLRGTVRGDEQVLRASPSARFIGLSLDVPPDRSFPGYRCTLEDAAGRPKLSVDVPAASEPGAPLNLLFPAPGLPPGSYTLTLDGVRDGSSSRLGRYSFVLQFH